MPRITARNLQRKVRIDIVDLARFAERALESCLGLPTKHRTALQTLPEISVLIVSDHRIASLNRRFLREPGPTDVITFQHGEIFVSAEIARRQARQFRTTLGHELRLYLVHGLLHLHGFDDRTRAGARRMERTQERIIRLASKH
ncbi:MAG: rRNA maturation RNase YbeY [Chthoniobacterales bacterium]